jgi:hypothetical protein
MVTTMSVYLFAVAMVLAIMIQRPISDNVPNLELCNVLIRLYCVFTNVKI